MWLRLYAENQFHFDWHSFRFVYEQGNMNGRNVILLTLLPIALMTLESASGERGDSYLITRDTIDAGGGTSQDATYRVRGTIGQFDTSHSSSDSFSIRAGFWTSAFVRTDDLFSDSFE